MKKFRHEKMGAQWLIGRVLDSRPRGWGSSLTSITTLCPLARHINPSLVMVQPRKTRPYITERLLMGRKESNQRHENHLAFLLFPILQFILRFFFFIIFATVLPKKKILNYGTLKECKVRTNYSLIVVLVFEPACPNS